MTVFFLGRTIKISHWFGILLCCIGIACVGSATILTSRDEHEQATRRLLRPTLPFSPVREISLLPPTTSAVPASAASGANGELISLTTASEANTIAAASAEEEANPNAWIGVVLVLAAQVMGAAQICSEEYLLKDVSPTIPGRRPPRFARTSIC